MGEPAIAGRKGFRTGAQLGRFVLGPVLARGGMGELYIARAGGAAGFTKLFALKVLLPQVADDPDLVAMFLHEARIAARLDHPNIASVIDLGEADGEYFIAMEYVHGRDLRAVLQRGKLPLPAALEIASRCCAALHYAHNAVDADGRPLRVIHRDVSPANVIVRFDGEIKLVDFGIAKASTGTQLTRTGMIKGKPGYMSPEQCLDAEVDHRTDVWGIAVLLYEMTTGRKLLVGDNDFVIMGRVIRGEIDPPSTVSPDYPPRLEAIVMRGLARDPDERFASALAMQEAIVELARDEGITLSPTVVADHVRVLFGTPALPSVAAIEAPRKRSRRWLPFAIGGTVATGAAVFVALQRPSDVEPEPPIDAPPTEPSEPEPTPVVEAPAVVVPLPVFPEPPVATSPTETADKPHARRTRPRRTAKPAKKERDLDALLPGSYRRTDR